jgi:hypothetical protein
LPKPPSPTPRKGSRTRPPQRPLPPGNNWLKRPIQGTRCRNGKRPSGGARSARNGGRFRL